MGSGKDENERIRHLIELDKGTLPADGGERFNRLIFATSPYLLQHAENPVDWYQWGDEAFAAARRDNKPVFLSIGYATCHWCHVMAHESFEDGGVAAVINRHFVPVKVDREERPDIDARYMTVAQMMTGSGGWPLTIVMTPEREPFFAATYLPREPRMGLSGIITILNRISHFWRSEPEKVAEDCAAIMKTVERYHRFSPGEASAEGDAEPTALRQLREMYNAAWGGFGEAPKFPMPFNISFLLRQWKKNGDSNLLEFVEHTLRQMRQGGIFDQIGFGFHRYSVDRQWLVPHFEKMLYDQALVSINYLEAYQATGNAFYRQVAEEIFAFVLREMTSPEGAFYAALDADSEGEEGKFYVWSTTEVSEVLGEEDAKVFCRMFDITDRGNFEGKNIPHLPLAVDNFAVQQGEVTERLLLRLERWRERLLDAREKRVRPFRDEKILTAWNGMMIAALAKGHAVAGDGRYLLAAERCVEVIGKRLISADGRLMRSYHLGRAPVPGFLEDYASLIWGLISLHEANGGISFLDLAVRLATDMLRLFRDSETGICYDSGSDTEEILLRLADTHDGVTPSGNSLAALVLCKLGRMTENAPFLAAGREIVSAVLRKGAQQPTAHLAMFEAKEFADAQPMEIKFTGPSDSPAIRSMVLALNQRFMPNLVIRHAPEAHAADRAAGEAAAYVCGGGACFPPVLSAAELEKLLESTG